MFATLIADQMDVNLVATLFTVHDYIPLHADTIIQIYFDLQVVDALAGEVISTISLGRAPSRPT